MRKLLDAAMVAFDQRGYHATRVNDVVDIAKTSHGTFYLYFSNKEDLLRALVAEAAADPKNVYDAFSVLPAPGARRAPVGGRAGLGPGLLGALEAATRRCSACGPSWPRSTGSSAAPSGAPSRGISYARSPMQIGPDSSGHVLDPDTAGMAALAMLDRFHYLREFVGRPWTTPRSTLTTMLYRRSRPDA